MRFAPAVVLLASFASTAISAQPVDIHDGFWRGEWHCGGLAPGVQSGRFLDGFTTKVTFLVRNGTGIVHLESGADYNDFTLKIVGNAVSISGHGAFKTDSTKAWEHKTSGTISGAQLSTRGGVYAPNGRVLRETCSFSLSNSEVQARAQADEAAKREAEALALKQQADTEAAQQRAAATAAAKAREEQESAAQRRVRAEAQTDDRRAEGVRVESSRKLVAPPPSVVVGAKDAPTRRAAVASLEPKAAAERGFERVTPNPVDSARRTGVNDVWISFNPSVTVQERQFCRIVENNRASMNAALQSRNQIKVNETTKSFVQAINSLLPDGRFQAWVMRAISIGQASDGSAAVLFELPCGVYVGSNTCDSNPKNYYGTVPEGSRVYAELTKMSARDFSVVSGQFVFPDDKAFDRSRSVAAYGYLRTAAHCNSQSMPLNSEFFGVGITALSVIK